MQEVFTDYKKSLRFSIPAVRPAFKYFATNSHTRFSYINILCCNLTSITDFFSFFYCYLRHISFPSSYILFFTVKASLFSFQQN